MKIVFFGSSHFSVPILAGLLESKHNVALVVTTPDKEKGRGQKVSPTVIKDFAQKKGLEVISPKKLSEPDVVDRLRRASPDAIAVAAYGKLIPEVIFKLPKTAAVNVHPSLLPRYRGASPIQQAILDGETETGVSILEITKDLDAGDIFRQGKIQTFENENAEELSRRLADLARNLLIQVLNDFEANRVTRTPQDPTRATYAGKIEKESGRILKAHTAEDIHRRVRAFYPWPSAFTFYQGKRVKVLASEPAIHDNQGSISGEIVALEKNRGIYVQTAGGIILFKRVQPEGRCEMTACNFGLGRRLSTGDHFDFS